MKERGERLAGRSAQHGERATTEREREREGERGGREREAKRERS